VHHKVGTQYRAVEIASEPVSDDPWEAFPDGVVYSVDEDYYLLIEVPAQRRVRSLRSLYCCSDSVRGRGAAVTYLSHSLSFHSKEQIAPSKLGIKQLGRGLMTELSRCTGSAGKRATPPFITFVRLHRETQQPPRGLSDPARHLSHSGPYHPYHFWRVAVMHPTASKPADLGAVHPR